MARKLSQCSPTLLMDRAGVFLLGETTLEEIKKSDFGRDYKRAAIKMLKRQKRQGGNYGQ